MANRKGVCVWKKHGYYKHPLYSIYAGIKTRCYSKNHHSYRLYGGVGVKMCQEWLDSPELFIEWALRNGWQKGMCIDKDIIPFKNGWEPNLYSPDTCSVVTTVENANYRSNTRYYTLHGVTLNCAEWARKIGVDASTIMHRINTLKWPLEKALSSESTMKYSKRINFQEAQKIRKLRKSGISCREIADMYGMEVSNVFLIVTFKTWKNKK